VANGDSEDGKSSRMQGRTHFISEDITGCTKEKMESKGENGEKRERRHTSKEPGP